MHLRHHHPSPAVVVGGGISGIACALSLDAAGVPVAVLDRGHRLGGRLASRTLRGTGTGFDGRVVDIGASYFTSSTPEFDEVVASLEAQGVVRIWTNGFHVAGPDGIQGVSSGPIRYSAPGGLRTVVEALASPLAAVTTGRLVGRVEASADSLSVDGQAAPAVALCMPGPQAARIADNIPVDRITWEPVLAVTCVFERSHWRDIDGVFVNDDPVITWIADDGSRRGDGAPVLVAHVQPLLSARHLVEPTSVIPQVVAAIQRVLEFHDFPSWVEVQRWTYAKPLVGLVEDFWIDEHAPLGMAGDAFADGPKVESAWRSGRRLGAALAARLGT